MKHKGEIMKRLARIISVLLAATFFVLGALPLTPAFAATNINLIANPSVETVTSSGAPVNWSQSRWGTNSATLQYMASGYVGSHSLYVSMTSRTDGDAKWMHDAVTIKPNTSYTYTSAYQSNINTEIDLQYTDTTGKVSYSYVGTIAPSSNWQTLSVNFIAPANASKVSVMHIVASVGWLQTDNFSLSETVVAPPPAADNFISNNSFETVNGTVPAGWNKNSWGVNNALFSYENSGRTGTKSAKVTISSYSSGDAKWYAEPVAVTAGASYIYQDYYKSTINSRVVAAFIDAAGNYSYKELAGSPASSDWVQYSSIFTAPASAKKVTILHLIDSVGSLTIDDTYLFTYAEQLPAPVGISIPNASFEIANGKVPANWQKNSWGTNTVSFSYLSNGHTGTKSAKVTISKYTDGDAKWYFDPITTLQPGKQYRFTVWYKTNVTPHPVAMFNMADGSVRYFGMPATQPSGSTTAWQKYSDTFIVPVGTVSTSVFMFISQVGWLQTDDYSLENYTPTGFNRPLLSLTFDDGHEDNVTTALPILNKYGLKTTQCYATNYIEGMDQDVIDGVKAFSTSGHEICSHSVNHPFLTAVGASQLTTELSHSQQYLQTLTGQPVVAFATPYGDYDTKVLNAIKQYYKLHRSVDEGFNSKDNLNPYNIRVQNILSATSAEQVSAWIAQAQADKTWLVLVYHRVANDPGAYDCYVNVFEQHIQAILNSGITVKTLSDAYSEVSVQ